MKMLWLSLATVLTLASCSSYQRDFRKAALTKPLPGPTGPWKGHWQSEVNGHYGPLWCLVSRGSEPDLWKFRYRAGWGFLQFGDYTHDVTARPRKDGSLPVSGKMTLPNNFGTYSVHGLVTDDRFHLHYQGSGDKGSMTLTRP
jgi:hypothetical protein